MSTPLHDAVKAYIEKDLARFHMPGHKGHPLPVLGEAASWDITEVAGADSLYEADGAIAQTESRYAALYGARATLLSAGGSTLCIQAMLALAAKQGQRIICARGCHTAAVNAMALLDLHPVWVYPKLDGETGLSLPLTAAQIATALEQCPDAVAVYLTSPDYFGVVSDIAAIASLCHAQGIPLLVDGAHGAHLRFLPRDSHPISLGADLCCDSLHKTLPVLTGGALLHIGNARFVRQAKHRMSLFGSTSPSYLILLSMDTLLDYLETGPNAPAPGAASDLAAAAARIADLEELALRKGFLFPAGKGDPIRLSIGFAPTGLSAEGFRAHLLRCGVEPEYLSGHFAVFLAGVETGEEDYRRLETAIATAPRSLRASHPATYTAPPPATAALSLREALLGESELVAVNAAENRVCAGQVSPCPPGIPLAMPGEILSAFLCDALKKYGISSVNVIK